MTTPTFKAVRSVTVGHPIALEDNTGDTWAGAWMRDGTLLSPSNDTRGFHDVGSANLMFNRIIGEDPGRLTGETVNIMTDYGRHGDKEPDRCTWKSSGCIAVDGAVYLTVARHCYGEDSGDANRRQPASNASLIRSTDGGKTWTRSARENLEHPMFPGSRFATPYFIDYGQDGREAIADGSDRYIYALSNDGFWDNGDDMILGRVLREKLPALRGADWQFLSGSDGSVDAHWTHDFNAARPVLTEKGRLASTGATFLPARNCYFMIAWHHPKGGGKMPDAHAETQWDFHTAPHPWGPWTKVGSHRFYPEGYYCPTICSKFNSRDNAEVYALTAGDWTNGDVYRATLVPLQLE